jgi:hypothetical protein
MVIDMVDISQCNAALIKDTYNVQTSRLKDWRLAERVDKETYNEIKDKAGANAVIYGVPVGASWEEFSKNVENLKSSHSESLREEEAINILWTGLSPQSGDAYKHCLDDVTRSPGIYLTVVHATETDVSINVRWLPMGGLDTVHLLWSGELANHANHLPSSIRTGSQTIVVKRPSVEQQLAVNAVDNRQVSFASDSIVLTSLPVKPSAPPPAATGFNLSVNDRLQFMRRGQGVSWTTPSLQAGSYNAQFRARLHPDIGGAQYKAACHIQINDKTLASQTIDIQFGDHPDVVAVGGTVDIAAGAATISFGIDGVWNADPTFGNFNNPDGGAVALSSDISVSLKKI